MTKEFIPDILEDAVSSEICRRCKKNTYCWQQNYSQTQKQFSQYAYDLQNNNTVCFTDGFCTQCDKTGQLAKSFENHYRLMVTQKLIYSQGKHNQRILQNQFLAMASILQEISVQSSRNGVVNATLTQKIDNFLRAMGKRVNYCICCQNTNRCIITAKDVFSEQDKYKVKAKLEAVYGEKFDMPQTDYDGENHIYTFMQTPMFSAEYGSINKGRTEYCGDVCEIFNAGEYAYVIIADGMGTGGYAQAEARTAAVMLKSLLSCCVAAETALELVNIALNLKGTGQNCVSADILQINLYNGNCNLYKAGGPESFLLSGETVQHIYRDSLPVGILKDTKISQFSFTMHNGDIAVIVSDGVATDDKALSKLKLLKEQYTVQQLSENLIANSTDSDDATVVVVKLVRT